MPDSVLGKVDRILDAVAVEGRPIGLSALARRSGIPKATVHRLVTELEQLGLLERIGTAVVLGVRLFELGHQVPHLRGLRHLAAPHVEELHGRTRGATVHFGVRDEHEILYLVKVRGHDGVERPSRTGGRIPLHCTATGRAMLAALDDAAVDAVIANGLGRMTRYTTTAPSVFREVIATARDRGFAVEREEVVLGWGAVAAPVMGVDGPVGALGVAVATTTGSPDIHAGAVRTAAARLGREISSRARPRARA